MFGHQDNHSSDDNNVVTSDAPPSNNSQTPPVPDNSIAPEDRLDIPEELAEYQPSHNEEPDHHQPIKDVVSPAGGYPTAPAHKVHAGSTNDNNHAAPDANDLIDIKQQALGELLPLVDKLDQTPVERFRTLMMMIQASDNQALIEAAFAAAHSINDEKARAQALLDIVNEINYFTGQPEN
jgi:hypothetical protein